MSDTFSQPNSCEPQHSQQLPTEAWGVDELGRYAQARHDEIESQEQCLAVLYWRLGLALNLARRQFSYGQWAKYLDQLGIDKTRASKARAIQRSFREEQAVQELSVQEAYHRRQRKSRQSANKPKRLQNSEPNQGTNLTEWLCDFCNQTDFYVAEMESLDRQEAVTLLPALDHAVANWERKWMDFFNGCHAHRFG